jgi:predicted transcriptional regulator
VARLEGDIERLNPSYRVVYSVLSRMSGLGTSMDKARLRSKTASDIMHRKVVTLGEHDTAAKAIQIVKSHDFAHIPVVNDSGTILGTIYQKSLLQVATEKPSEISRVAVASIMSPSLPQIDKGTGIIMLKHILEAFGSVLVAEKGKLLGIITVYDVLRIV